MNTDTTAQRPDHPSYCRHRRQVWAQILLPVFAAVLLCLAAPVIAWLVPANSGADIVRWGSLSTMWVLIPVMLFGLILLIVLAGLIFAAGQAEARIPPYSQRAQRITARIADGTVHAGEMVRSPRRAMGELGAQVKRRLTRPRRRA